MKDKATDKSLGNLHAILADVLAEQVAESVIEIDEETKTVVTTYTATPALLTVAARFLKDNDITCGIEDSKSLSDVKEELKNRKKRSKNKLAGITHIDEVMNA